METLKNLLIATVIIFVVVLNYKLSRENKILQAIVDETSKVTVVATAYNAVEGQTDSDPHITSCMVKPTVGSVAVSQDLFFKGYTCGKKVLLKGYGIFTIKDTMHYRKKN